MIRLSKLQPDDAELLVFDVRPTSICLERGTEPKVLLGKITPRTEMLASGTVVSGTSYRWESRWGGNCGDAPTLEIAQAMIVRIAKGMYK